jgi:pyruvate dehydrogenase E1 component alpha subunit
MLFLCENNGLAVHSPLGERQAFSLTTHAKAYGIESVVIEDGYDFVKLSEMCGEVLGQIKNKRRPMLLEVKTCRYKEHVGPGEDFEGGYRELSEIQAWKAKDPLELDKELIARFAPAIYKEIDAAVMFAETSPFPTIDDLLTDVI